MIIDPASILLKSTSTGAPAALARSLGVMLDKKGTAIAIVSQTDRRKLARVEKLIDRKIVAENLTGKELTAIASNDNVPYKKKKFFKKKPKSGPPSGPKA